MTAAREEIAAEVEALEAIYYEECTVMQRWPALVHVALSPRTGEDQTQEYVKATLVIRAPAEYPQVPPELELCNTKGLDDRRHAALLSELRCRASKSPGGPMLVGICEAAKDLLTSMNFPEGDCPFCMMPLVGGRGSRKFHQGGEDGESEFMKLLSCFHCFHRECFGRWWRWQQKQKEEAEQEEIARRQHSRSQNASRGGGRGGGSRTVATSGGSGRSSHTKSEMPDVRCPICRAIIAADDVAHVQEWLTKQQQQQQEEEEEEEEEKEEEEKVIRGDEGKEKEQRGNVPVVVITAEELQRRKRFAELFEAQKARGGIIEVKRPEVITPGMVFIPPPPLPSPSMPASTTDRQASQSDGNPRPGNGRKGARDLPHIGNNSRTTTGSICSRTDAGVSEPETDHHHRNVPVPSNMSAGQKSVQGGPRHRHGGGGRGSSSKDERRPAGGESDDGDCKQSSVAVQHMRGSNTSLLVAGHLESLSSDRPNMSAAAEASSFDTGISGVSAGVSAAEARSIGGGRESEMGGSAQGMSRGVVDGCGEERGGMGGRPPNTNKSGGNRPEKPLYMRVPPPGFLRGRNHAPPLGQGSTGRGPVGGLKQSTRGSNSTTCVPGDCLDDHLQRGSPVGGGAAADCDHGEFDKSRTTPAPGRGRGRGSRGSITGPPPGFVKPSHRQLPSEPPPGFVKPSPRQPPPGFSGVKPAAESSAAEGKLVLQPVACKREQSEIRSLPPPVHCDRQKPICDSVDEVGRQRAVVHVETGGKCRVDEWRGRSELSSPKANVPGVGGSGDPLSSMSGRDRGSSSRGDATARRAQSSEERESRGNWAHDPRKGGADEGKRFIPGEQRNRWISDIPTGDSQAEGRDGNVSFSGRGTRNESAPALRDQNATGWVDARGSVRGRGMPRSDAAKSWRQKL